MTWVGHGASQYKVSYRSISSINFTVFIQTFQWWCIYNQFVKKHSLWALTVVHFHLCQSCYWEYCSKTHHDSISLSPMRIVFNPFVSYLKCRRLQRVKLRQTIYGDCSRLAVTGWESNVILMLSRVRVSKIFLQGFTSRHFFQTVAGRILKITSSVFVVTGSRSLL